MRAIRYGKRVGKQDKILEIEIHSEGESVLQKSPKHAVIRVSPFRLDVVITKKGFSLDFRGLNNNGEAIEIHLDFPMWWVDHISASLLPILGHRAVTRIKQRTRR